MSEAFPPKLLGDEAFLEKGGQSQPLSSSQKVKVVVFGTCAYFLTMFIFVAGNGLLDGDILKGIRYGLHFLVPFGMFFLLMASGIVTLAPRPRRWLLTNKAIYFNDSEVVRLSEASEARRNRVTMNDGHSMILQITDDPASLGRTLKRLFP